MDLEIDTKGRSLACTIIIQEFPELSELLVDSLNNRTIWVSCLKQKLHGKQVREIRRHRHQTLRVNTASSVYISTFLEKGFRIFYKKKYMFGAHFCVQLVLKAATLPSNHILFSTSRKRIWFHM